MAQIPKSLRDDCKRQPEGERDLIVTVHEEVIGEDPEEMGLPQAQRLTDGVYKTRLSGLKVLELDKNEKIAEIIEDSEDEAMA